MDLFGCIWKYPALDRSVFPHLAREPRHDQHRTLYTLCKQQEYTIAHLTQENPLYGRPTQSGLQIEGGGLYLADAPTVGDVRLPIDGHCP